MASVDVFGQQLTRSVGGSRGPPGEGFKITLDGQYDMHNRRLCNLADPTSNNDAVSMRVLQSTVQQEVRLTYAVTRSLRNDIDDTSVMIRTLESQFQESLKNQRINNETVQDLAAHNSQVIVQLDERLRLLERRRENTISQLNDRLSPLEHGEGSDSRRAS